MQPWNWSEPESALGASTVSNGAAADLGNWQAVALQYRQIGLRVGADDYEQ